MAGAFQSNAFQNNAYQVDTSAVPVCAFQANAFQVPSAFQCRRHVGAISGGRQRVRLHSKKPWEKTFSRAVWEELQLLLKAEREAAERQLSSEYAANVLDEAVDSTREAIDGLDEYGEVAGPQVLRLAHTLNAATGAKTIKETLHYARLANEYAIALRRYIAELDDEEEAVALLLM